MQNNKRKDNKLRRAAIGGAFLLLAGVSFMCAEKSKASKIFMTNPADSTVSLIDLETLKEVGKIHVGPDPYFPTLTGDGKLLAVTVEGEGKIKYYDPKTLELVAEQDFGKMDTDHMMLLPDGKTALFADIAGNSAVFIDLENHKEISRIKDVSSPHNIQMGASENYAYMTSKKNPGVSIIDIKNRSRLKFIPTEVVPRGLTISPDEKTIYYGARWISGIFSLDIESGKVRLLQVPLPHGKTEMESSTYHSLWMVNDSILVGVNEGFSSVDVINVKGRQLINRYENVSNPSTVVAIPGKPNSFVVTCFGDNAVKIFDLDPKTMKLSLQKEGIVGQYKKEHPKRFCFWNG